MALEELSFGDEVIIRKGTFSPGIDYNIKFKKDTNGAFIFVECGKAYVSVLLGKRHYTRTFYLDDINRIK